MNVKKIYLDMDGVLADFDRGVWDYCRLKAQPMNGKRSASLDDLMWEEIRKVDHFYDRLELMPGAKEMFDLIYGKYGEKCEILTGIPKPKRGIADAGPDKVRWVRRILSDKIQVNVVQREEKLLFCGGANCILIDDREKSIRKWKEQDGTGILHISAEDTLEKLKEMGLL